MKKVRSLHYTTTHEEFATKLVALRNASTPGFFRYFKKQWVESRYKTWRLFDKVPTVPITNSAVESFNRDFKLFTGKRRVNMAPLLDTMNLVFISLGRIAHDELE